MEKIDVYKRQAYDEGVRDFGENKVQELVDKQGQLPADIRWHMIGHLQRNKVKYIIDKVYLIHSVDSLRLAEEISKEAVKHQLVMKMLIEVNVAEEESKFGVKPSELEEMCIRDSVISKYMKIDTNHMEIQISKSTIRGRGKNPSLYADIPILDLRN